MDSLTREQFVNKLLESRYYTENDGSWENLIKRVSKHGSSKRHKEWRDIFYNIIVNKEFIPSRMPFQGGKKPFSSSCFVFEFEDDSWQAIHKVLGDAIAVQRYSGGTGYNWSNLRPENDSISTGGVSSGPVSFMKWFHDTFQVIRRSGLKMAAQMSMLDVNHPDIVKFISCKNNEGDLWTHNISVKISDKFMDAVLNNGSWDLTWNGEVRETVDANDLFTFIAQQSWLNGEPGVAFTDTVNKNNCFDKDVHASNPCKLCMAW